MLVMLKAGLILFCILVVGDIISLKSKAKIPMMFVAFSLYLILTWLGMPKDLPDVSGLGAFGVVMVGPLIVHMATLVPLKQVKEQWRAIVVGVFGMLFAILFIVGIGSIFFSYAKMVSGTGALCGSVVAAVVTIDKLKEVGLASLAVIPLAIVAIQEPFGQFIAVNFLRKYASELKSDIDSGKVDINNSNKEVSDEKTQLGSEENPSTRFKAIIPLKYETPFVMLLELFAIASIAVFISEKTSIHWAIWCLVLGFVAVYFGLLRGKILDRANSMGITMAALLFYVFTQMNDVTPKVFGNEILTILAILILGIIGLIIGGIIGGKIVKWPKNLAIPVALNALFGFPGNFLISQEACRSVSENDKEKDFIMGKIVGPMLIGGYTTVTVGSVVVASFLIRTL